LIHGGFKAGDDMAGQGRALAIVDGQINPVCG
jgi:hypothetical protein